MKLPQALAGYWTIIRQVFTGLYNLLFKDPYIEQVAAYRDSVCRTNLCGYYDPLGESEKAVHPGIPACGACGCILALKVRNLDAECGLVMLDEVPLWSKVPAK